VQICDTFSGGPANLGPSFELSRPFSILSRMATAGAPATVCATTCGPRSDLGPKTLKKSLTPLENGYNYSQIVQPLQDASGTCAIRKILSTFAYARRPTTN
jgi:hypothetical protein